jgi:hypothetical protein
MTDSTHEHRGGDGTDHEADVVSGHDGARHEHRQTFERRPEAEQRGLQTRTEREQRHAEQQGGVARQGLSGGSHAAPSYRVAPETNTV